jgi:lauroyl/myristoyl acyltransferase
MNRKPFYIKFFVASCETLSHVISAIHYFFWQIHFLDIPSCIGDAPGGLHKNLQRIWSARLLKKFISIWVRSPWRSQVLDLVHFDIPVPRDTGLIFVTCHTPWKRLLVQWFFDRHYALIVDTGKSAERKNRLKTSRKGYNELFHIIRHLQYGGRVIIAADVFNKSNDHPAEILGKPGNLSLLPARLARIAGVPLLAAVPILRKGRIDIQAGPLFENKITNSEMPTVMQNLLGFFENEIKQDPSIWSYFVNNPLSRYHKKRIE